MVTQAALEWTEHVAVLHSVTGEDFDSSAVQLDWEVHRDLVNWLGQDPSHIRIELHQIGSVVELLGNVLVKAELRGHGNLLGLTRTKLKGELPRQGAAFFEVHGVALQGRATTKR